MFVSPKVVFRKLFLKFSGVCLLLEKLVNGKHFPINKKHFPVNRNTFRSTKNTFQSKKNLVWFPGKCFPFWLCLFSEKSLSKLSYVCLSLKKLVNGKHFLVIGKFGLVFMKVFSCKIWAENTFWKL